MGLHIGVIGPEELAEAISGQILYLIDELASAIVALSRIALGSSELCCLQISR